MRHLTYSDFLWGMLWNPPMSVPLQVKEQRVGVYLSYQYPNKAFFLVLFSKLPNHLGMSLSHSQLSDLRRGPQSLTKQRSSDGSN